MVSSRASCGQITAESSQKCSLVCAKTGMAMRTMAEESAQVLLTTCIGHRRPRRTPSEIQAMERAQMTATPAVGSGRTWSVHDLSLRRERDHQTHSLAAGSG
jgi:hypothetical protein